MRLDAGLLRAELAETYRHDVVPFWRARRARCIVGQIARLTGLSREAIIAKANTDGEHLDWAASWT